MRNGPERYGRNAFILPFCTHRFHLILTLCSFFLFVCLKCVCVCVFLLPLFVILIRSLIHTPTLSHSHNTIFTIHLVLSILFACILNANGTIIVVRIDGFVCAKQFILVQLMTHIHTNIHSRAGPGQARSGCSSFSHKIQISKPINGVAFLKSKNAKNPETPTITQYYGTESSHNRSLLEHFSAERICFIFMSFVVVVLVVVCMCCMHFG